MKYRAGPWGAEGLTLWISMTTSKRFLNASAVGLQEKDNIFKQFTSKQEVETV